MTTYPNAKINLGLNVVERRADGYHNIETIFYPIGLYDELRITPSNQTADFHFSSTGIKIGGKIENNLIIKALNLLKTEFEIPPVSILLNKVIPFGAGLGGGSADAAFTLKLLNEQFDLNISNEKLEVLAAEIGADCPFFIKNQPVFATGTGNIFTPIELSLDGYWLLLVKPDIHVSTPEAYAGVTPKRPEKSLMEWVKNPIESWKNYVINDFEESVFIKFPKIEELKNEIYDNGAIYASMSGSGSSVFGIFKNKPNAIVLKEKYKQVFEIKL